MIESQGRVEQFKQEIGAMRLRDPATARDRNLLRLGVLLMALGVLAGVLAYLGSHSSTSPLEQRDYMIVALIGLTVSVVGAALFVRYSVAQFLRFWLARLTYEQQAQTDRIIDTLTEH
jgi:magnesium-transporting ATPase (P-type)